MFDALIHTAGARTANFPAGAAIFRQGAPTAAIFQVRKGRVSIVRYLEDGGQVTIASAGPGDTFAEAALFADAYHCDAIARTSCEIVVVPTAPIRERLALDPAMAAQLAAFFARQVRDLRARVEILRIKRAPDRVLAWLRLQAKGTPPTVTRAEAWSDVAGEVGLSPEAFYRALRSLDRAGSIKRQGRGAVIVLSAGEGRTAKP